MAVATLVAVILLFKHFPRNERTNVYFEGTADDQLPPYAEKAGDYTAPDIQKPLGGDSVPALSTSKMGSKHKQHKRWTTRSLFTANCKQIISITQ